jgi:hypothetical protein
MWKRLLGVMLLVAAPAAAANTCVECHEALAGPGGIADRHKGFFESAHYKNGILCDACHSGDSEATDKAAAHAGVLPAANPRSTVYFKNVPRTCGRCHTGQLQAFTQSLHFRALSATGRGPNCVTCHGSMALRILKWNEVRAFCSTCHNERMGIRPDKPAEAEATLQLMDATQTLVDWADAAAPGPEGAEGPLARAHLDLDMARTAWHTFDLAGVRNRLEAAIAQARAARAAAAPADPEAPPGQTTAP